MTTATVIELSKTDHEAFLAREVHAGSGLDVAAFVEAFTAGRLDEADPEVTRLAALIGLGQNGR